MELREIHGKGERKLIQVIVMINQRVGGNFKPHVHKHPTVLYNTVGNSGKH